MHFIFESVVVELVEGERTVVYVVGLRVENRGFGDAQGGLRSRCAPCGEVKGQVVTGCWGVVAAVEV